MENIFCTECGTKLEPGIRFCTNCGVKVEEAPVELPSTHKTMPIEQNRSIGSSKEARQSSATVQPVTTVYSNSDQQDQAQKQPEKKPPYAVIVVVAIVVLLVGLAVVLAVIKPPIQFLTGTPFSSYETEGSQVDAVTNTYDSDKSQSGDTADVAAEKAETDEKLRETLTQYYDYLADYDDEVKQCATDFNNNFTKESKSEREKYMEVSTILQDRIQSVLFDLAKLSVPSNSKYKESYDNIVTLYDCLDKRITVICESWSNSYNYSKPADHVDEIAKPIARDNVDGVNKYKTLYDELYPKARP